MKQPNILFIVADHHTWHGIAARSPARTPNLNRLADDGLLFERSYTPISVCCPARAMLASGAYPWHNGVYNQVHVAPSLSRDMKEDVVTYSQRLREAGYRLGYNGKWHASDVRGPMDFGFHQNGAPLGVDANYCQRHGVADEELFNARRYQQQLSSPRRVSWPGSEPFVMWACDDSPPEETHTHFLAERASRMVTEFAANRDATEQPWHIEVHFPEPHDAYTPLRQFLGGYEGADIELPRSYYDETFENKPRLLQREANLWAELDEADFKAGLRHFYAYCEQVDHYVGRLLQTLESSGQSENTLVVFTADHGDMAGAHRLWIKGWMPYEEAHRIPMIARWPQVIAPGGTTSALVQLHDWAHTFCALARAEPLPFADGKDLTPFLREPQTPGPDHILNCYYGAEFLYTQRISIGKRFKYVFNGFDWDEFYDLERDPGEIHNAIDDSGYEREIAAAREALWAAMQRLDDPYAMSNRYGARRYLPGYPAPTA